MKITKNFTTIATSLTVSSMLLTASHAASDGADMVGPKYKLRSDEHAFYLAKDGEADLSTLFSAGDNSKFYIYAQ